MNKQCRDKRRYHDRVAALYALSRIQANDNPARVKTETRAYKCHSCHGWHLTSKEKP